MLLANLVYENANAVMPAGWDINWVFSPAANKGRPRGLAHAGRRRASSNWAHSSWPLGTSDTGSRSVGEAHDARAATYVKKVTTRTLASGLLAVGEAPVELNWGPQPCYPTVKLTLTRAEMGGKEPSSRWRPAKNGTITVNSTTKTRCAWACRPSPRKGVVKPRG